MKTFFSLCFASKFQVSIKSNLKMIEIRSWSQFFLSLPENAECRTSCWRWKKRSSLKTELEIDIWIQIINELVLRNNNLIKIGLKAKHDTWWRPSTAVWPTEWWVVGTALIVTFASHGADRSVEDENCGNLSSMWNSGAFNDLQTCSPASAWRASN